MSSVCWPSTYSKAIPAAFGPEKIWSTTHPMHNTFTMIGHKIAIAIVYCAHMNSNSNAHNSNKTAHYILCCHALGHKGRQWSKKQLGNWMPERFTSAWPELIIACDVRTHGEWLHRCSWPPLQLACTADRLFAHAFTHSNYRETEGPTSYILHTSPLQSANTKKNKSGGQHVPSTAGQRRKWVTMPDQTELKRHHEWYWYSINQPNDCCKKTSTTQVP